MARKRPHEVKFRMNDHELELYKKRLLKSGLSGNSFGINCLLSRPITVIANLGELSNQLRGLGNNINQIAKYANSNGELPNQIKEFREGIDLVWRLLRHLKAANGKA